MALIPWRAPGPDEPANALLLLEFRRAQETLDRAVATAQALPDDEPNRGARLQRYNALQREVDRTYERVRRLVRGWATDDVPTLYAQGFLAASVQLRSGVGFSQIHQDAVAVIAKDAYDDVATGLQQVPERFRDKINAQRTLEQLSTQRRELIRVAGRRGIAQQLILGELSPAETARALRDELWAEGVEIIDRSGRRWQPERYARMLVRTKSANAFNVGSLNKLRQEGLTRVRVFDGVNDPECARANGQIWTVDYAYDHVIAHPNCVRAFAPEPGRGILHRATPAELARFGAFALSDEVVLSTLLRQVRRWRAVGQVELLPPRVVDALDRFEVWDEFGGAERLDRLNEELTRLLRPLLDFQVPELRTPTLRRAAAALQRRIGDTVAPAIRAQVDQPTVDPGDLPELHELRRFERDVQRILSEPQNTIIDELREVANQILPSLDHVRGVDLPDAVADVVTSFLEGILTRQQTPPGVFNPLPQLLNFHRQVMEELGLIPAIQRAITLTDHQMLSIIYGTDTVEIDNAMVFLEKILGSRVTWRNTGGINGRVLAVDDRWFLKTVGTGYNTHAPVAEILDNWVTYLGRRLDPAGDLASRQFSRVAYVDRWETPNEGIFISPFMRGWETLINHTEDALDIRRRDPARPRTNTILNVIINNRDDHDGNILTDLPLNVAPGQQDYRVIPIDVEFSFSNFTGGSGYGEYDVGTWGRDLTALFRDSFDSLIASGSAYRLQPHEALLVRRTMRLDHPLKLLSEKDHLLIGHASIAGAIADGFPTAVPRIVLRTDERELIQQLLRPTTDNPILRDMQRIAQDALVRPAILRNVADWLDENYGRYFSNFGGAQAIRTGDNLEEVVRSTIDAIAEGEFSAMQRRIQSAIREGVLDLNGTHHFADFAGREVAETDVVHLHLRRTIQDIHNGNDTTEVEGVVYATLVDENGDRRLIILNQIGLDEAEWDPAKVTVYSVLESDVVPVAPSARMSTDQLDLNLNFSSISAARWHDVSPGAARRIRRNEAGHAVGLEDQPIRFEYRDWQVPERPADIPEHVYDRAVRGVKLRIQNIVEKEINGLDPRLRPTHVVLDNLTYQNLELRGLYLPHDDGSRASKEAIRLLKKVVEPEGLVLNPTALLRQDLGLDWEKVWDAYRTGTIPSMAKAIFRNEYTNLRHTLHHELGHRVADVRDVFMEERLRQRAISALLEDDDLLQRHAGAIGGVEAFRRLEAEEQVAILSTVVDDWVETSLRSYREILDLEVDRFFDEQGIRFGGEIPDDVPYPFRYPAEVVAGKIKAPLDVAREFEGELIGQMLEGRSWAMWIPTKLQRMTLFSVDDIPLPERFEADHLLTDWFEERLIPWGQRLRHLLDRPRFQFQVGAAGYPEHRVKRMAEFRAKAVGSLNDETVIRQVYEHDFGDFYTKVSTIERRILLGEPSTIVSGSLFDKSTGATVGAFNRRIIEESDGLAVYHSSLFINNEFQGRGWGTLFFEWTEDWYVALGVKELRVDTARVGGYNWARRGFDFALPTSDLGNLISPHTVLDTIRDIKGNPNYDTILDAPIRRMLRRLYFTGQEDELIDRHPELSYLLDSLVESQPPEHWRPALRELDVEEFAWGWKVIDEIRNPRITEALRQRLYGPDEVLDQVERTMTELFVILHEYGLAPRDDRLLSLFEGFAETQREKGIDVYHEALLLLSGDLQQVKEDRFWRHEQVAYLVNRLNFITREDWHSDRALHLVGEGFTAFDLSQLGAELPLTGFRDYVTWFGKEHMLGKSWHGIKRFERVADEVHELITREEDVVQLLQEMTDIRVMVIDGVVVVPSPVPPSAGSKLTRWTGPRIDEYTGNDFMLYNRMARGETEVIRPWMAELQSELDEELLNGDSALEAFEATGQFMSYRGVRMPVDFWENLLGRTWTTTSVMSTSFDPSEASGFAGAGESVILVVRAVNGAEEHARFISPLQLELVYPRGSTFFVRRIFQGKSPVDPDVQGLRQHTFVLVDFVHRSDPPPVLITPDSEFEWVPTGLDDFLEFWRVGDPIRVTLQDGTEIDTAVRDAGFWGIQIFHDLDDVAIGNDVVRADNIRRLEIARRTVPATTPRWTDRGQEIESSVDFVELARVAIGRRQGLFSTVVDTDGVLHMGWVVDVNDQEQEIRMVTVEAEEIFISVFDLRRMWTTHETLPFNEFGEP